ncbi:MAG: 23S rRNA (guanosine(2251)-2'-O)-methyltransferase RlmB [Bdellovibrionaceae bacterium]|nr:23S rRNA (guanosine(2251)-2'-O)-methyltransferase RlmB [Pseudobdellovibrionaceae bacterium]
MNRKRTDRPQRQAASPQQRIIAGTHAVHEVLKVNPKQISKVVFTKDLGVQLKNLILDMSKRFGFVAEEKAKSVLDNLYTNHQNAIVWAKSRPEFDDENLKEKSLLLFLDGVEDPHNLGAITRSAWLLNADGIYIPDNRSVDLTPTTHKVACGGVEHVPIMSETNFKNPIERFKELGFWVYGLSHKGRQTIFDVQLAPRTILVLGAEDKGMRSTTETLCDELVSIPQASSEASFNVSVAAALSMYEYRRQNFKKA